MNYLSHYLIDGRAGNANYNFGLALPDLINISKRGWRPVNPSFQVSDPNVNDIWQGVQQHFARDAVFHNSELFDTQTRRLRLELENHGLNEPGIKLFFVAHVLLEILIDRHIILTRKWIPDQFYADMEEVDDEDIKSFFRHSGHEMPDRFFEFFHKFKESKYLYNYAGETGIFFALNRLLRRTGQPEFSPERESALNQMVVQESDKMAPEFELLFAQ